MSVTRQVCEYFQGLRRGQVVTGKMVMDSGLFDCDTALVYQALAALAQPGKPLQRAKNVQGIYEYQLVRDFDLRAFLKDMPERVPRVQVDSSVAKPAAAQVPAARETAGTASAGAGSRQVEPATDVKGNAASSTLTPAAGPKKLILPTDEPNPHRAEVLRFIDDLRIRRAAIDEVIELLESTFKVTHG